jgi:hypothetical protein
LNRPACKKNLPKAKSSFENPSPERIPWLGWVPILKVQSILKRRLN